MKFKKKIIIFAVFLILIISILPDFMAKPAVSKISPKIAEKFNNSEEKVRVVIKLKQEDSERVKEFSSNDKILEDVEENERYKNYISKEVSLKELKEFEENPNVESVLESHEISAFLQQTVHIVNSSLINSLKISNFNLTGTNITVCIIDSGVDFIHPDLAGKNKSCIIDCFDKACIEDCSVGDDNGHGTHVAGIVGASGKIFGISNNVSMIGVKILDENGYGSGNDLDLSRAIDYCASQNTEVITMSLGTVSLYNSDCSSSMGGWTDSIDSAFANNISIIAASGNNGNFTHIASPACIGNVTPVGDTYDANIGGVTWTGTCTDSTTLVDKIVCHANRNSLVKLFAPGALINSTKNSGYAEEGGTSMAAPVVAGGFAIVHQLLNLTGRSMSGLDIEDVFNLTGKTLNDALSGESFTRMDVYEAVLSLDTLAPNVSLNSPSDSLTSLNQDYNFSCNYSDWQLSNVSFYLWNSSGLYYNETLNVSGNSNVSNFSVNNLKSGNYKWNCFVYDNKSNLGFADANFSLTVGGILVSLDLPLNDSYTNHITNFTCNLSSENNYSLKNVSFYLWNSSSLVYNESMDIDGTSNQSIFNYSFNSEIIHYWNCFGFNNGSNSTWAENNRTITYDISVSNISLVSSLVSATTSLINWTNNETTNYSINYGVSLGLGGFSNNVSFSFNHSVLLSGLSSSSTYYYNITYCDIAGNCNMSGPYTFTTSASSPVESSSSGGGGGGGSSFKTYVLDAEQSSKPYTQQLNKNDKIKFTFFDEKEGTHLLTVNEIGFNFAEFTIQSEPIKIKLGIGQSAKLNLTSPDYYNLYLRLNSINNGKADLTIQTINELIIKKDIKITGQAIDESEFDKDMNKENENKLISEIGRLRRIIYILVVIILIIVIFLLTKHKKPEVPRPKKVKESFLKNLLDLK